MSQRSFLTKKVAGFTDVARYAYFFEYVSAYSLAVMKNFDFMI